MVFLEKDTIKDDKNLDAILKELRAKSSKALQNVCAAPISKKLPWMNINMVPQEFLLDLQNKKKPNQRYYLMKFLEWESHQFRPLCTIIRHIGEAGNLEAESLRLLKMHDICSEEYEPEGRPIDEKLSESLRVFTKDLDPKTQEWIIPQ